jgi:hypothetical protein
LCAGHVADGEEADDGEEDHGAEGDFGQRRGRGLALVGARPDACAWVCHGGKECGGVKGSRKRRVDEEKRVGVE